LSKIRNDRDADQRLRSCERGQQFIEDMAYPRMSGSRAKPGGDVQRYGETPVGHEQYGSKMND